MQAKNNTCGFSLLEVLVALAIFAVVSIATYKQIASSMAISTRIDEKYLSFWVGKNVLEPYFFQREWPSTGEEIIEYNMAGRDWYVKAKVSETEIENIRLIEINVCRDKSTEDNPIITLRRMIGKN